MKALDTISRTVDAMIPLLDDMAADIWAHPELGWSETHACARYVQALQEAGFTVEEGFCGMPTAFRAQWGSGHPVVGLTAEYDCLPGLSQDAVPQPQTATPGAPGHGCGHNLLGVGAFGAACAIKAALEEAGTPGTVVLYGTPAEEGGFSKAFMARDGAFRECDLTLAWHPSFANRDTIGKWPGVVQLRLEFTGATAHAGLDPQAGRSALDGLQLTNIACEFLREHIPDGVRIHYIITDGGRACNIVPGHAEAAYGIRALDLDTLEDVTARVIRCAEGAAHATDTTLTVHKGIGLHPGLQNRVLAQAAQEARTLVPQEDFDDTDLAFAEAINRQAPAYKQGRTPAIDWQDETLTRDNAFFSTDYAELQFIAPGFQLAETIGASLATSHSWMMTACAGSPAGRKGMHRAAKLLAVTAWLVMTDPARLEAAKAEFTAATAGRPYSSLLGPDAGQPWKKD